MAPEGGRDLDVQLPELASLSEASSDLYQGNTLINMQISSEHDAYWQPDAWPLLPGGRAQSKPKRTSLLKPI